MSATGDQKRFLAELKEEATIPEPIAISPEDREYQRQMNTITSIEGMKCNPKQRSVTENPEEKLRRANALNFRTGEGEYSERVLSEKARGYVYADGKEVIIRQPNKIVVKANNDDVHVICTKSGRTYYPNKGWISYWVEMTEGDEHG